MWTTWEFKSVDGKQVVRRVDLARGDDFRYQHEYQKIVYRGNDRAVARAHLDR